MPASIPLQGLVPGLQLVQLPGGTAGFGSGRQVFVYQRGTQSQVSVFADPQLTVPLSQPLTTGTSLQFGVPTGAGTVPGYIAPSLVGVDFYDVASQQTFQAEPLTVGQLIGTDGKIAGPGTLGLSLPGSTVNVGTVAPGTGATGDQFLVRSDGTVQRFTPSRVLLSTWGVVADGVFTSVTIAAAATTFTVPSATFKAGMMIAIKGAGVGGAPLMTTILSVTPGSPNDTITLANAATYAVTAAQAAAATDQAAAIQAAINALAPNGATLELPGGKIGLSKPVDFNIKGINAYTSTLRLEGWGGSTGTSFLNRPATTLLNFSADETILTSSPGGIYGLELRHFACANMQDTGPNVATIYLSNWYAHGVVEDVNCVGTGVLGFNFTGTIVPGSPDTITGVSTFAPTTVTNVKTGDYIYAVGGAGTIVVGTTITAINPVAGTITLSSSGTATSGVTTLSTGSPNVGIGFWLDNPANGHQVIDRVQCTGYCSGPGGTPPPPSPYLGEGFRFGAQIYSTTNITGTATFGSNVINGISSFANWSPGATITVTGGTGVLPGSTYVLRVNRTAGTATISANATHSGTMTMTMATTGVNSGNFTVRACSNDNCTIGLHLAGALGAGGQMDGCTFDGFKHYAGTVGIWIEEAWCTSTINAHHIEGAYYGILIQGALRNKINSPLLSKSGGTMGDGSVGILIEGGAYANEIDEAWFEGNGWDTWVQFAGAGTWANRVRGGGGSSIGSSTPMSHKIVRTVQGNIWIDNAYEGWTAASLNAGLSPGFGLHPPGYRMNASGEVELQGLITSTGAVSAHAVLFTLPADLTPTVIRTVPCFTSVGSPIANFVQVQTNGDVQLLAATSGAGSIELGGNFPLDV